MPVQRISEKDALGAAPASNDVFPLVDVSDTTEAASGTLKKVTMTNVIDAMEANANTFTALQTVAANVVGAGFVVSNTGAAVGVDLRNDTFSLLDFRNQAGSTLYGRLGYTVSNATMALESRAAGASIINFVTTNGAGVSTNAMRIDGNQYLLIGYTTSNGAFRLQVNSQIYATNATVFTSDSRVKENVETLADGLAAVLALRPVVFDFVEHDVHNFSTDKQVGFIAQEIETALADDEYLRCIVPEAQNEEQLKGVAGDKIVALLVRAVQQQQAQIEALTARVEALEGAE